MAVIDPVTDAVVIRVVYDGAPFAGKTTSVRALGNSLGSTVVSPGEIAGRTLYFDWLDYTGGLFEGRRIRCQIISVPGQAVLAPRRRRLLDSADVVVYVLDSSAAAFSSERAYLDGLKATLASCSDPPVGVIVQANKRDLPDAVPIPALRQMLEAVGLTAAVVETNAAAGSGVRESFVLAVRLALDRVRELLRTGQLLIEKPEFNDHIALLNDLQSRDRDLSSLNNLSVLPHTRLSGLESTQAAASAPDHVIGAPTGPDSVAVHNTLPLAAQALMEALADNEAHKPEAATQRLPGVAGPAANEPCPVPLAPDDRVASGLIWPVVVGRTVLNEITSQPWHPIQSADTTWTGTVGDRWRLTSAANATFANVEHGRDALLRWARMHVTAGAIVSTDRCIVLSNDHHGQLRLWQIFRNQRSLAERLQESARSRDARCFATTLLACSIALGEIYSRPELESLPVTVRLDDLSIHEHCAVFIGGMPMPNHAASVVPVSGERMSLELRLSDEFAAMRDQFDAHRCQLAHFLEEPTTLFQQTGGSQSEAVSTLSSYVRHTSPDRMEKAILQLTALMVAA
jgi:signal recognition particle receptor subunit beta